MAQLIFRDLVVGFDGHPLLSDFNYTFSSNSSTALMGRSGVGKTTLGRTAAGILRPLSGHVLLDGNLVTKPTPQIILVFQRGGCFPWLTTWENLLFPLRLAGIHKSVDALTFARELLSAVGLEIASDRYPHQLSGGMIQRLALARALVVHPRILILDEPFSALDMFTRWNMYDLLARLQDSYRFTLLLITHDLEDALALTDNILLIHEPPSLFSIIPIDAQSSEEQVRRTIYSLTPDSAVLTKAARRDRKPFATPQG